MDKTELQPNFNQVSYVTVDENHVGQRIDNFLLTLLKGIPKSHIYRLVRKGEIRINKKRIKPEYKLQLADIIRIAPVRTSVVTDKPRLTGLEQRLAERILHEDEGLIVLNKPSGVPVHGGTGIQSGVIEALRNLRTDCNYLELVHRLDRDTSGCLLIAKNAKTLKELHELLKLGQVKKSYITLVHGNWPTCLQVVDLPLKKNIQQSGERVVKVNQEGKAAKTYFEIITHFDQHSLVMAKPVTGRTHQIRVHSAAKGFPIVGDPKYGNQGLDRIIGAKRLFLHASNLKFQLSNGQKMDVTAELEPQLQAMIDKLQSSGSQAS